MSKWEDWASTFIEGATSEPSKPAKVEPNLTTLGNTRGKLIEQLAEAYAQPHNLVVKQYIAEARRRLSKLS